MSNQEKREIINQVMHLLRCGEITSATPNCEVWKFFNLEDKRPDTAIKSGKEYRLKFMWNNEWHIDSYIFAESDDKAIQRANETMPERRLGKDVRIALFDGNRMVKEY